MDSIIPLGQTNTLAEYMILFGANNHPPMLDKDLYDSWKSIMELYMQNREHGRMILESVENGPLIWPTVEENEDVIESRNSFVPVTQTTTTTEGGAITTTTSSPITVEEKIKKKNNVKARSFRRFLPSGWNTHVVLSRNKPNLDTMSIDDLYNNFKIVEQEANLQLLLMVTTVEAKVKTVNGEQQIQALVDKKKVIITKTGVRSDLHLEDAEGTECLPTATIFKQLTLMGAKSTAWNEFSSTMASAIIYLTTNQKFNFPKYIFDHMVNNLEDGVKFLMFQRFVQVFLDSQVEGMPKHKEIYVQPSHTKKIIANMKRHGKDFSANQALEIGCLKRRVKKLENKASKKTHKIKRLYKIGSSIRVESAKDAGLGDQKDASKQERMIEDLDTNKGIALVNETQPRNDQDMFDISILDDEEVVAEKEVSIVDLVPTTGEVVTSVGVEVSTAAITSQISMDEITL
nr:hypothetical protein [Tanacetum cinerariifolium]